MKEILRSRCSLRMTIVVILSEAKDLPERRHENDFARWMLVRYDADVRTFCVYILSSRWRRLYIGVTNDLGRRVYEHKAKLVKGYTNKYNIDRLVYFETTGDAYEAIVREKQLKGLLRAKKIRLIESVNPDWRDLYEEIAGSGSS